MVLIFSWKPFTSAFSIGVVWFPHHTYSTLSVILGMAGITVKIRSSTGSTFEIEIEPDALTVYELKELLTKSIPGTIAADLRLVYSGRILKDPEEVSSYSKLHSSIMYKAHHLAW